MKTIPADFKVDERSYTNLRKHGILPDFIDDQLDGFCTYWQETGKKKKSWQMTLQVWMRRAHQGSAGREWEENRHIRERHSNKPKDDLFDNMLEIVKLGGTPPPVPPESVTRNYRKPEIEIPTGPAMSPEEAFKQLSRYLK